METPGSTRWLLLTHHLPPEPAYFRVRVRRRLERIGAVALKSSVYVLPRTAEALEDFQWLFQEIERDGGEATVSEARFVDGVTEGRLLRRFRDARETDYAGLVDSARSLRDDVVGDDEDHRAGHLGRVQRLERRLAEVVAVDYFQAPGRVAAEHAVSEARRRAAGVAETGADLGLARLASPEPGRTWVTRQGVHVDRMASAWLIRRFIDREARFVLVADDEARRAPAGELRFDMLGAEFAHVGDRCTFETLLIRFGIMDPALAALAEIVHDIDCKDAKFNRGETSGVAAMVDGIVRAHAKDPDRLDRGAALFDGLYEHFRGVVP